MSAEEGQRAGSELKRLITKLEKLKSSNFEIENLISATLGLAPEGFARNEFGAWTKYIPARDDVAIWRCPAFTTSIDSAASLVPDNHDWSLHVDNGNALAGCEPASEHGGAGADSRGATPAIALCIAALRARTTLTHGEGK